MAIDLYDMRLQAAAYVTDRANDGLSAFENFTVGDVGVVLVTVGIVFGLYEWHRSYQKKRGYRMVLRERDNKIHDLLSTIINDGLFEAECRGEISNQEVNRLYQELSKKMCLPDLVPRQRRASIIKSEIKGRLNNGVYKVKPVIPGDRPWQGFQKFRETIGKASRFWKTT